MKKFQTIFLKSVICFSLLLTMSCRDTTSGQKSGTAAGQEANGNTRGTDAPPDNQNSGGSPKAVPSEEKKDQ